MLFSDYIKKVEKCKNTQKIDSSYNQNDPIYPPNNKKLCISKIIFTRSDSRGTFADSSSDLQLKYSISYTLRYIFIKICHIKNFNCLLIMIFFCRIFHQFAMYVSLKFRFKFKKRSSKKH